MAEVTPPGQLPAGTGVPEGGTPVPTTPTTTPPPGGAEGLSTE